MKSKDVFRQNFGPALARKLKQNELSQLKFAEIIGRSRGAITFYLKGTRPEPDVVRKMAQHFECDYNILLVTGKFISYLDMPATESSIKQMSKLSELDIYWMNIAHSLAPDDRAALPKIFWGRKGATLDLSICRSYHTGKNSR